jgi:uncharacterized membrane protein YdjX (TVP38/TMEM64 family)
MDPGRKAGTIRSSVKKAGHHRFTHSFYFSRLSQRLPVPVSGDHRASSKGFLLIASIGRMPGTLMLSVQGEFVFQKNYVVFAVVFGVTVLAAFLSIRYRETIYRWMEKLNGKTDGSR